MHFPSSTRRARAAASHPDPLNSHDRPAPQSIVPIARHEGRARAVSSLQRRSRHRWGEGASSGRLRSLVALLVGGATVLVVGAGAAKSADDEAQGMDRPVVRAHDVGEGIEEVIDRASGILTEPSELDVMERSLTVLRTEPSREDRVPSRDPGAEWKPAPEDHHHHDEPPHRPSLAEERRSSRERFELDTGVIERGGTRAIGGPPPRPTVLPPESVVAEALRSCRPIDPLEPFDGSVWRDAGVALDEPYHRSRRTGGAVAHGGGPTFEPTSADRGPGSLGRESLEIGW